MADSLSRPGNSNDIALPDYIFEIVDGKPTCTVEAAVRWVRKIQERYPGFNFTLDPSDWIEEMAGEYNPLSDQRWSDEVRTELDLPLGVALKEFPDDDPRQVRFWEIFEVSHKSENPVLFFAKDPIPSMEDFWAQVPNEPHAIRAAKLIFEHARIDVTRLLQNVSNRVATRTVILPTKEQYPEMMELGRHLAAFCRAVGVQLKGPDFAMFTVEEE